jgi:hypothetical protein
MHVESENRWNRVAQYDKNMTNGDTQVQLQLFFKRISSKANLSRNF